MRPNQSTRGCSPLCFRVSAEAHTRGDITFDEYIDRMLAHLTGTQHPEDISGRKNDNLYSDPLSMAVQGCLYEPNFSFLEDTDPLKIINTSPLKTLLVNSWNGLMSNVKAEAPSVLQTVKPHGISRNILETLFCIACIREDHSLLEYCFTLVDDLSDLRKISEETSIFVAARNSPNVDTWRLLLDNGFCLGRKTQNREECLNTLASMAMTGDLPHTELLELLVQHGFAISDQIFSVAARKLDAESMRWLVSKCEARNMGSGSLIIAAACNGRVVEILIDAGMDINYEVGRSSDPFDGRQGTFPLLEAAGAGNLDVVKLLLERGAIKEKRNSDGWSAAKIAAKSGYADVAEFIQSFVSLD